MLSRSSGGSGSPTFATAALPPSCTSQANGAPSLSRIATTASVISGPIPSPGMSVAGICWLRGLVVILAFLSHARVCLRRKQLAQHEGKNAPVPVVVGFDWGIDSQQQRHRRDGAV